MVTSAVEITTFEDCGQPEPLEENPFIQGETVERLPCSNAGSAQGGDVGTQSSISTHPQVTPSMAGTTADNNLESCSFKRGGMCIIHKTVGTRNTRTTKSWKQRKDGSFGYVTSKKIVYTCKFSNQSKPVAFLGAGCKLPETDGVTNNGSNNDLLWGLSSTLGGEVIKKDESESKPPDP